jgi:hypothetical protein
MLNKKTLILIVVALILIVAGYFIWQNNSEPTTIPELNNPVADEEEARLRIIDRDIQRTENLNAIGAALIEYGRRNDYQYPIANNTEKISDENSPVFKMLKDGGYLDKLYQDPIPDKNYYGYTSDGSRFDLTASLENPNDGRCIVKNNLCIYALALEEVEMMMYVPEEDYGDFVSEPYVEGETKIDQ